MRLTEVTEGTEGEHKRRNGETEVSFQGTKRTQGTEEASPRAPNASLHE